MSEQLVEELLRSGMTSMAVVMHGGVMMALLISYGPPRASAYEWMTEPGCEHTLRTISGLQICPIIVEVITTISYSDQGTLREHTMADLARKVVNRTYEEENSSEKQGLTKRKLSHAIKAILQTI